MKKWHVWTDGVDKYELEGQKWLLGRLGLEYRVSPATEGYQGTGSESYQIEVKA